MKIVLFTLNASFAHSSLSLRCLRPPLEQAGHTVILQENTLKDRTSHVLEELYGHRADVYGFSCYIWNLEPMLLLAQALHDLLPTSRIVLGGPEVSFDCERFEALPFADVIVRGEGEDVLPRLCAQWERGEEPDRIQDGECRDFLKPNGFLYRADERCGTLAYYESSRGCPYSCAYCLSSATTGVRAKDVPQVLEELAEFERLPTTVRVIKLVDRTFNFDIHRANAIWSALLDEKYTKCYHFEICAALLNEESFAILSRFPKGKVRLEIGLQSTNQKTLSASARHLDAEKTLEATGRLYQMGNLHVHLDLIAGLPYEDYASFARSFDEAYGACDVLQLGFLKLLHGTALRRDKEKYGYRFLSKPPYTVLQSRWISFAEMQRLSRIAEVLERYCESGAFPHTLWYLNARMPSPFAFFEGLSEYYRKHVPHSLQRTSQPDAFRHLLEYAMTTDLDIDPARLREYLRADFSEHEHKNPPYFLREQ
ncbi:MAG: DUF4080 domain-containing protein [Clostridia bacterium]|nr:DUF4080 domain-containing protein [Clostridia bacterium]